MDNLNKLRQYCNSLNGLQDTFLQWEHPNINHHPVDILKQEIDELLINFPSIVPLFDPQKYFSYTCDDNESYYNCAGIKAYLSTVSGRLKAAIDEPQGHSITEHRDFDFIANAELRKIIERDFNEIQRAKIAACWKSVIVLCGGAIEAILTDVLLKQSFRALASSKAPKEKDITRWGLSDIIDVCVDLNLISAGVDRFSHSLREYRNLIHPGIELRKKITFDAEEAKVAVEVFNIVYRDRSLKEHNQLLQ